MITVLTGPNSFLLQDAQQRLVKSFVAEHGDMALELLDGEEVPFDRIREALQSMPFLASNKLVVIRTPSSNKQFTSEAEPLLSDVPECTDVVLIEPKLDKRLGYYKFLKKHADLQVFDEMDGPKLAAWLERRAKELGATLSRSDAAYLIARVGPNQQLLAGEIEKLRHYSPAITKDSIDQLTDRTPQSTTFDLLDAALSGKPQQALSLYKEQRDMKVEPQQILALLGWQLHILAVVKSAGQRDPSEIASAAKLNPYVVRKTQGLARSLSGQQVKSLVRRTRVLDQRLKSEPIDADEALQNLLLSISV